MATLPHGVVPHGSILARIPDATPARLSLNEMPWGPLPAVTEAITQFLAGPNSVNRYPDMRATALRSAIAELRRRGFGLANSQANFVWPPVGTAATALAAALERAGVATRCIANHGVRVTIGLPDENDRFLAAFGTGELVDGLTEQWPRPTLG